MNIVLGVCLVIYALSLINRKVNLDDGMLGEHAYWMAKQGYVKTLLFAHNGIGWHIEQFHYHKLFIWIGALFIKAFGWSLPTIKSVSLVFTLLFGVIYYKFLKKHYCNYYTIFFFSVILLIFNANYFDQSFMFRPEVMVMTLGFISYFFLDHYNSKSQNIEMIITAGLFAGLAALAHLNGLIFITAGFFLLVVKKRFKDALIFGITASLTASFYFINIASPESFEQWIYQFTHDPNLRSEDFSLVTPIKKILTEHKRFFHSHIEAAFSITLILSLLFSFKKFQRRQKEMLIYFSALIVSLAGLAHGPTAKYAILYYPFFIFFIAFALSHAHQLNTWKKSVLYTVVIAYFIIHSIDNIILTGKNFNLAARNHQIAKHIPLGSTVYAPGYFIFDELQHYKIKGPLPLKYAERYKKSKNKLHDYFQLAKTGGNEFVVVDLIHNDRFYNDLFENKNWETGMNYFGYVLLKDQHDYLIFQSVKRLENNPI